MELTQTTVDDPVLTRTEGAVAVVTLNRPQVMNAFTLPMATAYAKALRAADADPAIRAILVTGTGRCFCAGADIGVLRQGAEAIRSFVPTREDLPPQFALGLSKPVIVALNGPVVGIGLAYMMGSDVRFAAASASVNPAFSRLGLVAEYGLSWLLPRVIGLPKTLDLLLSGRTVSATEAAELGLVKQVVPDADLFDTALRYATEMADACAPSSLAAIKAQVYADLDRTQDDALTDTLARMDASFGEPDLGEALQARTEKRPPIFLPPPAR